MSDLNDLLVSVQQNLKAPKGQFNAFGKYKYRSCEDILEAVKPLLGEASLTISDEIVAVLDRVYVKATVTLSLAGGSTSVSAFARESLTKKGMDDSQITGTASSYARKYALSGLFLIDDQADADTMDNSKVEAKAEFKLDTLAQSWIKAINDGTNKLEEIQDPEYRKFIAKELLK